MLNSGASPVSNRFARSAVLATAFLTFLITLKLGPSSVIAGLVIGVWLQVPNLLFFAALSGKAIVPASSAKLIGRALMAGRP